MKRRKTTMMIKEMPREIFAEFSCGDSVFGELFFRDGAFVIEIYPPSTNKWELDLDDFLELVEEGKRDIMRRIQRQTARDKS